MLESLGLLHVEVGSVDSRGDTQREENINSTTPSSTKSLGETKRKKKEEEKNRKEKKEKKKEQHFVSHLHNGRRPAAACFGIQTSG